MNQNSLKNIRVLAIAPHTSGLGFVVLEGQNQLIDWGGSRARGDKNAMCLKKIEALIAQYQPEMIVLQDTAAKASRRSKRIKALTRRIQILARSKRIKVALITRQQVTKSFFGDGKGTKHQIAQILAERFPHELGTRLPPKRRLWENENPQMAIFDALGLAFALCRLNN